MEKTNIPELEKISVHCSKKKIARDNGAFFDDKKHEWFIPGNISDANKKILRNLSQPDIEDNNCQNNNESLQNSNYNDNCDWKKVLSTTESINVAFAIKKYGLPSSSEKRTKLLTILGYRGDGQYEIDYDSMVKYSKTFAKEYSPTRIKILLEKITQSGKFSYSESINNKNITDEERAILNLVLPL